MKMKTKTSSTREDSLETLKIHEPKKKPQIKPSRRRKEKKENILETL